MSMSAAAAQKNALMTERVLNAVNDVLALASVKYQELSDNPAAQNHFKLLLQGAMLR